MKRLLFSFGLLACWFGVLAQCPPGLTPVTLPFTEDFESYSGPKQFRVDTNFICGSTYHWNFEKAGTSGLLTLDTTIGPSSNSGSKAAIMSGGTGANGIVNYLTLTQNLSNYDTTGLDIFLDFYFADMWDEPDVEDRVWIRGNDTQTWVEIYDWSSSPADGSWHNAVVNLTAALKSAKQNFSATTQIRWGQNDNSVYYGTSSGDGLGIDDVKLLVVSCNSPSSITASNIGSTTLDLSWTTGGATAWQVSYDTAGMAVGANITNVTGTLPFTVSGLQQGVTYDFYVRDSCAVGDVGFWTGPYTVTMNCAGYTAPYSNNFDSEVASQEATCWSQYATYSSAYAEVRTGGSPLSGNQQLSLYSSFANATNDTLIAISPQFTDMSNGDKQLRFFTKASDVKNDLYIGTISAPSPTATFIPLDTVSFSTTNTYQEVIVELNTANGYNGTDEYVVFAHSLDATYDYIYVDNLVYETIPACKKPLSFTLDAVTDSTASIGFDNRGNSSYDYMFGPVNFNQATATVHTTNTYPIQLDSLYSNYTYEIYVRNNCGTNGTSVWSGPFTFTTACAPFNLFSTDFESDDLDDVPDCWSYYETYSSAWIEVEDYGTAYSGDQAFILYNGYASTTGGDTIMGISPKLEGLKANNKQIRFYAQSSDNKSDLIIGTLPSQDGKATFSPIDTIDFTANNTYQEYVILLDAANGYNGTDEYVAFIHGSGTTADYIYIDDFNYEMQPSCLPTLATDINLLNVTGDSVFFNWTPGDGLKFKVEIGLTGFTPGTGLYQFSTADTFAGIGSLNALTGYDIYIQDSCALSLAPATGPVSFTTDCDVFVAPFLETFDTWGLSNDSISYCWSRDESGYIWEIEDATTPSSNTGPTGDYSGSGYYMFTEASSGSTGDTTRLTSARVDVSGLTQMEVAFYYHMYGADINTMFIEISDGVNTYSGLGAINGQQQTASSDPWEQFVFNPAALSFVSDTVTVSIVAVRGSSYEGDISIDEFEIREALTCATIINPEVTTITTTTADFTWLSGSGNSNLNWGPTGFNQGSGAGNFSRGVTSPSSITGLTPNTTYDVYFQDSCVAANGVWIGPITFTTPCAGPLAAGTYTIGSSATADFATFDSVATLINGCGIGGPVVFNIEPGRYVDRLHLMGVPGVSSVNTITFNGSGADTLVWDQQGPQAAVLIDSVKKVTLNNMRIENITGAEAWGILITNHSDSVTIDSCIVEVDQTSTSGDISPIVVSDNYDNDLGEDAFVDYLTVTNSTLIGGYYGITLEGNGTDDFAFGHVISDNTITAFSNAGIRTDDLADVTITNNLVETSRATADGIYLEDIHNFRIEGNTVNVTDYGIYVVDGNDGQMVSAYSTLINNMVSSTTDYGIYLNDVEKVNVFHNSALGEPGFAMNDQDTIDIRNNVFASSSDYAFESFDSIMPVDVVDYNLYYSTGTNSIRVNGTNYTDLPAWQAAYSALNANSVEGNPFFVSATDLHLNGTLADEAGDNSVGVTIDIDGDARPGGSATTVDMGADEFVPVGDDVGIVAIINPKSFSCGDSNTVVSVVVQNFGQNTASSFPVTVNVSGAATATLTASFSGSLANLQRDTLTLSSFNSVQGGQFTITAFTSLTGDQVSLNDTLETTLTLNDVLPIAISASDSAFCAPQAVTLWADTNYTGLPFIWNDINGNPLGTGDSLVLSNVDSTTTVVLSVDTANTLAPFAVGAKDTTIGSAGTFANLDVQSLIVKAHRPVTINQLKLYPENSGTLILELRDSATGTIVESISVPVVQSGAPNSPVTVVVNLPVPVGTFELGASASSSVGDLLRNSTGAAYPYGDPNTFEITNSTFGSAYYYYYYDLVVSAGAGCYRPSSQFTINYGAGVLNASFTSVVSSVTATSAVVDFDATASAPAVTSYDWDFGDGNTGTGVTPQHTYSANGTYNVRLVVTNSCETDTLTQQVVIEGISLEENALSRSLEIFPNPTSTSVNVSFDAQGAQSADIRLMDLSGRQVRTITADNLNGKHTIEVKMSDLADGVYMLSINAGGMQTTRRIIKQ
jgi:parallel beta-helix repeat protein